LKSANSKNGGTPNGSRLNVYIVVSTTLLATLFLMGCGGSSDSDNSSNSTTSFNSTDTETIETQFPSDTADSGSDSLIVTGINTSNQDATSAWVAETSLYRSNASLGTTGEANVRLFKNDDDTKVSELADRYSVELDVCEVVDPDLPFEGIPAEDNPFPYVSGGNEIVINTPSGPWFTLSEMVIDEGQSIYRESGSVPGELLPDDATWSIPGAEFPTVAAHRLYDPVSPDRLLPDEDTIITTDAAYTWITAPGKNYMKIELLAYSSDGDYIDRVVECNVKDDGTFTMPTEVTDFVSKTPHRLEVQYTRVYNRVDYANGILIHQQNSIAE